MCMCCTNHCDCLCLFGQKQQIVFYILGDLHTQLVIFKVFLIKFLDRLIKAAFDLLGLQTFLTAGPDECRAWTIVKGTTAPKAAGKIHTDFERGFIRAEIVNYNDLIAAGSVAAAREKGQVRVEGKDYVMQDGDVVNFRFNV